MMSASMRPASWKWWFVVSLLGAAASCDGPIVRLPVRPPAEEQPRDDDAESDEDDDQNQDGDDPMDVDAGAREDAGVRVDANGRDAGARDREAGQIREDERRDAAAGDPADADAGDAGDAQNGFGIGPQACMENSDCTNPRRPYCGLLSFCVECLTNEHCAGGQSCDLIDGDCELLD